MSGNKILLTGAGFTYNFALPLAEHVWNMIFNHPKRKKIPKIRERLLNKDIEKRNFERVYSEVLNDDQFKSEKKEFLEIIDEIYNKDFEKLCVRAIADEELYGVSYKDLRAFILQIYKNKDGQGFLFTLNQDLFLERLFLSNPEREKMIISPYVGNCIYNFSSSGNKKQALYQSLPHARAYDFKNQDCFVPQTIEELNEIKKTYHSPSIWYYKLHGSIGWRYKKISNKIPIIMGTSKEAFIHKEPLFQEYFNVFKNSLCVENSKLLIIGYSFSDKHINEQIIKATQEYGLKLHIINPNKLFHLVDTLKSKPTKHFQDMANCIFNNIDGYYPGTLKDFFPFEKTYHSSWNGLRTQLQRNFFESK